MNTDRQNEITKLKYDLWGPRAITEALGPTIVAEGDSWFDYPVGIDILDHLKRTYRYNILKFAEHGDTLENMTYGTGYKRNYQPYPPSLDEVVAAVKEHQPAVVLLSAGGNDIAGDELENFLNHRDAHLDDLRKEYVQYAFTVAARGMYEYFLARVMKVQPKARIITHGYGYPDPDGRYIGVVGIHFSGPWLRPALTRKRIMDREQARKVMRDLVNALNIMLDEFAAAHPKNVT